ncbi:uncharacterized protein LOC131634746 [Vicia villosa]|uniref:uncharacterized protein LOC131634746 n=1 Tax=Vicia villosa TaxID=3911 RepID=UPI00273B1B20|nr:uncharacterized protein LOC131634746 [Vicia villosa]
MNIMSFNIRGCGCVIKRRSLRKMIDKGQADMVFLQETKTQVVDFNFIRSLWGHDDCEWTSKDSNGASGGLSIIWKKGLINPLFSFRTEGSVGIGAEFQGQICFFVNVYSSCHIAGKRLLWSELVELKQKLPMGWWCVGGDFNAIRNANERQGNNMITRSSVSYEFNDFIDLIGLVDVPTIVKKFTWSNKDGSVKSRLDRFLLSSELIDDWKIGGQKVGDWDISDHAPIWLTVIDKDWGPKPFRVINGWFEIKEFKAFAESSWKNIQVEGNQAYVVKEKFKLFRNILRRWNKEKFGRIDLNIQEATKKINGWDVDCQGRVEAKNALWKNLHLKESLLRQKSRQKWLKEGDSNTKYFHQAIKERRRRNNIVAVHLEDGSLIEDVVGIRKEVLQEFKARFKEAIAIRPTLENEGFMKLSLEDRDFLEAEFSREEIKAAVWDSDGEKCPGPDGFNLGFIQNCWNFMQEDIVKLVMEFHKTASLPKSITACHGVPAHLSDRESV